MTTKQPCPVLGLKLPATECPGPLRTAGLVCPLRTMQEERKVYLAYYHTGFTDEPSVLLDVCDSSETATAVIEGHKLARNKEAEYAFRATWWIDERELRNWKPGAK